jgi:hypothetical protein
MDVSDKNCEGPDNQKKKKKSVAKENLGASRLKRCKAQTA